MSGGQELKPCAHCGGEASVQHAVGEYWVLCPCEASTKACNNETDAVKAWNKRANTLTAEQVREAVDRHILVQADDYYSSDWQAIANELNGVMGA